MGLRIPPGLPQGAVCLREVMPGRGHMPQTSESRAGASSRPTQERVVLMAGVWGFCFVFLVFFNHFYKTSLWPSFSRVERGDQLSLSRGLRS